MCHSNAGAGSPTAGYQRATRPSMTGRHVGAHLRSDSSEHHAGDFLGSVVRSRTASVAHAVAWSAKRPSHASWAMTGVATRCGDGEIASRLAHNQKIACCECRLRYYRAVTSRNRGTRGYSAARLAHLADNEKVGGSNPPIPTHHRKLWSWPPRVASHN